MSIGYFTFQPHFPKVSLVKLLLLYTIFSYGNFEFFTLIFWDTIAEITIFQGSVLERATLCSKRQIAIAMSWVCCMLYSVSTHRHRQIWLCRNARKNKAVYHYIRGQILKLTIEKLWMKYKTQFGYSVTV